MVIQNRLYSDSEEVVALQVFSEVIEMEGKKVNMAKHDDYVSLTWPSLYLMALLKLHTQ